MDDGLAAVVGSGAAMEPQRSSSAVAAFFAVVLGAGATESHGSLSKLALELAAALVVFGTGAAADPHKSSSSAFIFDMLFGLGIEAEVNIKAKGSIILFSLLGGRGIGSRIHSKYL